MGLRVDWQAEFSRSPSGCLVGFTGLSRAVPELLS